MKILILLTFSVLLFITSGFGQIDCGKREMNGTLPAWLRGHAGNQRSDTIDVLHYDLHLNFRVASSQQICGAATIHFVSKTNNVNGISLDLLSFTVDSVLAQDGTQLSFSYNDTLLRVQFPSSLTIGDTSAITVYYRGQPQMDPSGWGGFYFQGNYFYNLGVGFSVDPHNFGRAWHPCFDNFAERATYTYRVLTSAAHSAYCNGERESIVVVGTDSILTVWQMEQPIPTYLASVAVSAYTHARRDHVSALTGDTIPVWLIAQPTDTTNFKNSFVNIGVAINAFESRFGAHQYSKIGFALVPFNSGAMEHATNIAYPRATANGSLLYQSLMAHELSHHWWGDWVTTASADEMWINEGFARWCEHIFFEELNGYGFYLNEVRKNHYDVLRFAHLKDSGHYALNQVPHAFTYGDHSYNKGADVIHTMRGYMGDSLFYQGLRYIQQQYAETHITSEQFRDAMHLSTGYSLTDFFNDWIFAPGQPHIAIDSVVFYGVAPNLQAQVFLKQKRRARSHFATNVPLTVSFVRNDFTSHNVTVHMSGELLSFTLPLDFQPSAVFLNRDDLISHAVSAQEHRFVNMSSTTMAQALMTISPQVNSDTSYIRVEHHWVQPDPFKVQPPNMVISKQRFWNVYVNPAAGSVFNGRIDFNGTTNTTNGWLDNELLVDLPGQPFREDSIVMLFRPNAASDWVEYPTYLLNTQGSAVNKTGQITIQNMVTGQYALGYKTFSVSVPEAKAVKTIGCYPNPANETVTFNLPAASVPYKLSFFTMDGRLASIRYYSGGQLSVGGFAKGLYQVQIEGADGNRWVTRLAIASE